MPTIISPVSPPTKARAISIVSVAFSLLSHPAQICDTLLHTYMTHHIRETKIQPIGVYDESIDPKSTELIKATALVSLYVVFLLSRN